MLLLQEDKIDPVRSKFGKLEKEEVTLVDKLEYVSEYIKNHKRFSFRELLTKQSSRTQIVVTFLAILQLMKEGAAFIEQEQPFDFLRGRPLRKRERYGYIGD